MADLFGDLPPPSTADSKCNRLSIDPVNGKRKAEPETCTPITKQPKLVCFRQKGYFGERKGEREDMQDHHTIIDDLKPQFSHMQKTTFTHVSYYGIFDGHAGHRAAMFASEHLHKAIIAKFPAGEVLNMDREMKKCLVDAYKLTDEDFLRMASQATPSWKDGSTAVTVLVLDDVIYCANVGDSKAFLCRRSASGGKLAFIPLTKEHSPSIFEERKRIEKAGGSVRDGRVMGVVEVSRSIGDGRFKHCGVISTPDVVRCSLTENDLFIIMACDGLWKAFTIEEAARCVVQVLEDDTLQLPEDGIQDTNFESTRPASVKEARYGAACNRLAVEAVKRNCTDNVTVMVVDIFQTT